MHLATVRSTDMVEKVVAKFNELRPGTNPDNYDSALWIGLHDTVTEGTYEWRSHEPLGYTNWHTMNTGGQNLTVQPDGDGVSAVYPVQDCVTLLGVHGTWLDFPCDQFNIGALCGL